MHRLPRSLRLRQQNHLTSRLNHASGRRPASRIAYRQNGEAVRYQAVRLKTPWLSMRRVATVGLYTGAIWVYGHMIWRFLDIEIDLLDDMDLEEEASEEQLEEGEALDEGPYYAEDDSLFIPLTWATKMPRSFYKGTDPEWQVFIQVAKDKPRHKKIQEELVQIVYTGSVQHPLLSRQLGLETKVGKYWLDITFPDGPPQEYERSGIEVGDGFVAWSQQKISPENQWRLSRALWPTAAFNSLWMTGKVLAGIQYRRFKQALGWDLRDDPFTPEEQYQKVMEMMRMQQHGQERKQVGKAQTEPDATSDAIASASATNEAQPAKTSPGESKRLPWQVQVPMPSASQNPVSSDLPIAMHVFSATISKYWNPKKAEPPRGTFVVQGLVEIRGTRGRVLIDVQSCYDPKTSKFVAVHAGLRNFKRWNQSPRGGP